LKSLFFKSYVFTRVVRSQSTLFAYYEMKLKKTPDIFFDLSEIII
jgi:hypothetical protein